MGSLLVGFEAGARREEAKKPTKSGALILKNTIPIQKSHLHSN